MSDQKLSIEEEPLSPDMFSDPDGETNISIAGSSEETNSSVGSFMEPGIASDDPEWKGLCMEEIYKNNGPFNWQHLPPIHPSSSHTVLFALPLHNRGPPKPYPTHTVDKWNQGFVRLPCSAHSLYPIDPKNEGTGGFRRRWEVIQEALLQSFLSSQQLEAAILSYNHKYAERWNFSAIHHFFNEYIDEEEAKLCLSSLIPKMVQLALQLPELITGPIPLLKQHTNATVSLSQLQVASLLANAFFCTFPRRNSTNPQSEYANYPDINFNRLFASFKNEKPHRGKSVMEKIKSLFHYFRRVTSKAPEGTITIQRRYIPKKECPRWDKQSTKLLPLHITSKGTIETEGAGLLQVDFANKYLGGGVLNYGCVQEEIRFVICPELFVTMLITEALDDTEALIINGVERYSNYKGYSNSFKWVGDFIDETPRDSSGRLKTCIVAIDALYFTNSNSQFNMKNIIRELNKAYVGFSTEISSNKLPAIATGNWGCGAFRGNPQLKVLIQLMAASVAGRSLMYFTFGDTQLRDSIIDMYWHLVKNNIDIGQLFALISDYPVRNTDFYSFLYNRSKIKPLTQYFSKNDNKKVESDTPKDPEKKSHFNDDFKKHASIAKLQEVEIEKKIEHWLETVEDEISEVEELKLEENNEEEVQIISIKKKDKLAENVFKNVSSATENTSKSTSTKSSELFCKEKNDSPTGKKITGLEIFNELIIEEKNASSTDTVIPMEVESQQSKPTIESPVDNNKSKEKKMKSTPNVNKNQKKISDFFKKQD